MRVPPLRCRLRAREQCGQNGWRNGHPGLAFEKRKRRLVIGLDSVYVVVPFSRRAGNAVLCLSLREVWEKHFVIGGR